MSTEYLLRLEAVNLPHFLGDTQNLSTIRGGGLALLNAVGWTAEAFGLTPVTSGASTGIFAFEADGPGEAEERRREVERFLQIHAHGFETLGERGETVSLHLAHATFVVDVVAASGDLVADRERLLAKNRWRQMASPSLAVPEGPSPAGVCGLDRLRPAAADLAGPAGEPVSASAWERWQYGRAQKQRFYEELTGERFEMGFSQHFEDLTSDPERGILHRKMAVLYLDGNRFGAIQNEHCRDRASQRAFDEQLREHRRRLLQDLLQDLLGRAREDPGFLEAGGEGAIRFETLLWGGDEILWVVPAWRGWATLAAFYEHASSWTVRFPGGAEVPLHHAGGLLFCHHSAPIYRVREMALELAELAKRDPERDLVAYEVLETFDDAGGDLDAYRARRAPRGVDHRELTLDGVAARRIEEAAGRLLPLLPHRQVVDLVHHQVRGAEPDEAELAAGVARLRAELPAEDGPLLDRLIEDLGGPTHCFLHLAELWHYLKEQP